MKSPMKNITLLFLTLMSTVVHSAADDPMDKQFTAGFGTYATVIAYDDAFLNDDELSGISFSFSYAVSDIFALRASYFSTEHDDVSAIDATGLDLLGHVGVNMASPGFKAYIGGGMFTEEWEFAGIERTFNGLQLSGGIGYNWESVALDFILNIRDASDYEEFVSTVFNNVEAGAASGSLLLSFRF